jgi:hypothetical protein
VKSFRTIYKVSSECHFVGEVGDASAAMRVPDVYIPPNGNIGDRLPKSAPLSLGLGIENGGNAIMGEAAVLTGNNGSSSGGGTPWFFSGPGARTGRANAEEATGRSFG